jgi:hypothetical protein
MSSAFAQDKPDAFNSRVAQYRQWLAANGHAAEVKKTRFEAFSNLLLPFVRAVALYAVALVLVLVARRTRSATAYRSALMMVLLASTLHATGSCSPPSWRERLRGSRSWVGR